MFTYRYAQPDEYHFSLDSIHLAEFVAEHCRSLGNLGALRVLDLCAGCGVIGFQLSWYLRELREFDFVEVQEVCTHYFYQNLQTVNRPELNVRWHNLNYNELLGKEWENKFDLIISNPPYFLSGHGMLSPSEFKNRSRFFIDSTIENFIYAITNSLARNGRAYFLLRPLKQHGYDLFSDIKNLLKNSDVSIDKITQIRGTDVVFLEKC